jgi:CxxC motif-containing protein (DUF1111 family)
MQRPYLLWYALALVLALTPAGLRVLSWRTPPPAPADAALAQAGEKLFKHEWKPNDPLSPGGDGLGPVFNARSCVACHRQGGVGGSGGLTANVTTFVVQAEGGGPARAGVVHKFATRFLETLALVHPQLPSTSQPTLSQVVNLPRSTGHCIPFPRGVHVSQRNTPALFGDRIIDAISDRDIIANARRQHMKSGLAPNRGEAAPVGRVARLTEGRVGKFGWKAQSASLADFVQAACANELGLGNPGQAQPAPLGNPNYRAPGLDLTQEQCDQMTNFIKALPAPVERLPQESTVRDAAAEGKRLFAAVGCADCHTPDLGPAHGIYSDLLLHRMGETMQGGGSYNEPPRPVPDLSPGEGPLPDG